MKRTERELLQYRDCQVRMVELKNEFTDSRGRRSAIGTFEFQFTHEKGIYLVHVQMFYACEPLGNGTPVWCSNWHWQPLGGYQAVHAAAMARLALHRRMIDLANEKRRKSGSARGGLAPKHAKAIMARAAQNSE